MAQAGRRAGARAGALKERSLFEPYARPVRLLGSAPIDKSRGDNLPPEIDGEPSAMQATTTDRVDAEKAGVHAHDPYAAIVDQLQHSVMQLVRATLEKHARSDMGLAAPLLPIAPQGPVPGALSQREREVLQRIAAGDSNKMIARALCLSPHTVKRHVANILDKLGARTRSQAAVWLQRAH